MVKRKFKGGYQARELFFFGRAIGKHEKEGEVSLLSIFGVRIYEKVGSVRRFLGLVTL